jgi:hypothetical protein
MDRFSFLTPVLFSCAAMLDLFISPARFAVPAFTVRATVAQVNMDLICEYTCCRFLELQTERLTFVERRYRVIQADEIPKD